MSVPTTTTTTSTTTTTPNNLSYSDSSPLTPNECSWPHQMTNNGPNWFSLLKLGQWIERNEQRGGRKLAMLFGLVDCGRLCTGLIQYVTIGKSQYDCVSSPTIATTTTTVFTTRHCMRNENVHLFTENAYVTPPPLLNSLALPLHPRTLNLTPSHAIDFHPIIYHPLSGWLLLLPTITKMWGWGRISSPLSFQQDPLFSIFRVLGAYQRERERVTHIEREKE